MRTTIPAIGALLLMGAGCAPQEPLPETPPRLVSPSPFQYPEELWDAEVEGETTLRIFVSAAGGVDSARVEVSSGHEAFDQAALEGSRELRFEPARRGTEPVAGWFRLPVRFDLLPAEEAVPPESETTP